MFDTDRPLPERAATRGSDASSWTDEIADLRRQLQRELRALRRSVDEQGAAVDVANELSSMRAALAELEPTRRSSADVAVAELGVEGPAAAKLRRALRGVAAADSRARLRVAVREMLRIAPCPIDSPAGAVVCLVGPPGVGKTTTLAKLAARGAASGRTIAIASSDDHRVGATAQIQRWAELLGAPFYPTPTPTDLTNALAAESVDLWFIDTSGLPPTASSPEVLLRHDAEIPGKMQRHVVLCLDATTRAVDAAARIRRFKAAQPTTLCITKLDDAASAAGAIHAAHASGLPISTLCSGPRVPEDVTAASHAALEHWLFRDSGRSTP